MKIWKLILISLILNLRRRTYGFSNDDEDDADKSLNNNSDDGSDGNFESSGKFKYFLNFLYDIYYI